MEFHLRNFTVHKGEKISGFLDLPFTDEGLPATVIYGQEDGDTVLITGGIHNAEYVGIEAVTGLARELDPEDVKGFAAFMERFSKGLPIERAAVACLTAEDGSSGS